MSVLELVLMLADSGALSKGARAAVNKVLRAATREVLAARESQAETQGAAPKTSTSPPNPSIQLVIDEATALEPGLRESLLAAAEDPDVAVRLLLAAQTTTQEWRNARAHGRNPRAAIDVLIAELPALASLQPSPDLLAVYEATLAHEFPWADSDSLMSAALWCALRDRLRPSDDEADDEKALREDGDFLALLLGAAPALVG